MPYGCYAIFDGTEDQPKPRPAVPDWTPARQYKAPPLPRCFDPLTGRIHAWPNGNGHTPEPQRIALVPGERCEVFWSWRSEELIDIGLEQGDTDAAGAADLELAKGWYAARYVMASKGDSMRGFFVLYDEDHTWPFWCSLTPTWVRKASDKAAGVVPRWAYRRLW